ncbi:MAG: response regulator [Myxococcales bacterium FL481]|nr:MAG: response regulator [Myxococcales bacterium FL481]
MRILIVDDDEQDRALLHRMLRTRRSAEHVLIEAANVADALRLALADPSPDCVLVDYNLLGESGIDFIRALRAADGGERLPIVMLSGAQRQDVVVEAMRSGANDYVSKEDLSRATLLKALHDSSTKVNLELALRDELARRRASETLLRTTVKQLSEAKAAAEAATRAKSQFLSMMSHEIRTPMNGVLGMSELLRQTVLDDYQRDCVETVVQSSKALIGLLDDLLDLAKIESGRLEIEHAPFNLAEDVLSVVTVFSAPAQAKGLRFDLVRPTEVPAWLVGDAARVRQIVANLVGNAVKFTESGHVRVLVELTAETTPSPELRIRVEDTGIGIAAEQQAKVFEAYVQADASTTRKFGGTGLGLNICARLAALMGGTISLASELGEGSRFELRVPVAIADDAAQLQREREKQAAVRPLPDGLRVLVADDNPVNQKVVRQMLRALGCEPHLVGDGQQAVSAALERRFDVILMDCEMPQKNGFDATREIRGGDGPNRDTPIVALTANAQAADRQRCFAAGMSDFLTKPVARAELSATLHCWISRGRKASGDVEAA